MKKTSLVALVALTASVMADDMGKSSNMNGQQRMMQRSDSGMMNVSSYPMIDSNNWDLWADAICWRPEQAGSTWAIKNLDNSTTQGEEHFRKVDFDWEWGFKVGVGYTLMNHDEWDMQLYYTWLHAEQEDTAGIATTAAVTVSPGINPFFAPAATGGTSYKQGDVDWTLHYSMIDWELGRGYNVSKHLTLRPHIGVKGGWIHQHLDGQFTTFTNVKQPYEAKNNFWGVGPSGGVNTKWHLGNYDRHFFSLLGDFGGAWMWGHWNVKHGFTATNLTTDKFTNLSRDLGAVMLQSFMGFGYDTNFNKDQCHFAVRLGYEVQYWFNQLQFFPPNNAIRYNYDLTLQGGTLDFRFDF